MRKSEPTHAYASGPFVKVHQWALSALGTVERVLGFEAIRCRCEDTGTWQATMDEIAEVSYVSERTARRATKYLRERGLIKSERVAAFNPTMIWQVVEVHHNAQTLHHEPSDGLPGRHAVA